MPIVVSCGPSARYFLILRRAASGTSMYRVGHDWFVRVGSRFAIRSKPLRIHCKRFNSFAPLPVTSSGLDTLSWSLAASFKTSHPSKDMLSLEAIGSRQEKILQGTNGRPYERYLPGTAGLCEH